MAVAAVSRDTMRSFSPPAATPVTVSVTATLLLAELALTDGASMMAGGSAELEFRGSAACGVCSPLEGTPGANSEGGSSTQWARWTAPSWPNPCRPHSGRRATSCGNGASHGQNAAEGVIGVRKLLT